MLQNLYPKQKRVRKDDSPVTPIHEQLPDDFINLQVAVNDAKAPLKDGIIQQKDP